MRKAKKECKVLLTSQRNDERDERKKKRKRREGKRTERQDGKIKYRQKERDIRNDENRAK